MLDFNIDQDIFCYTSEIILKMKKTLLGFLIPKFYYAISSNINLLFVKSGTVMLHKYRIDKCKIQYCARKRCVLYQLNLWAIVAAA